MSELDQEQRQEKTEDRNVNMNQNSPEILTNTIYTPAFLRQQIGRLMRVEFLIGTNNMTVPVSGRFRKSDPLPQQPA